ncbi:MAG: regulatory protein RecX [Deltaproteobacteria bacterium]|nr:regulatory protein RecX [Deltaproteobacteria bacterium]
MPSKKESRPDAVTAALRFLASRPRSVAEVRERLGSRGFEAKDVDNAVNSLIQAGYLDDGRFAERLCGSRVRYKNWGPVKIACELKGKGVSEEIIHRALGAIGAAVEARTAGTALRKWAKKNGVSLPVDRKDRKAVERAFRFLKGRGFSNAMIFKALDVEESPEHDGAEG